MVDPSQVCSVCEKAKQLFSTGSFTRWLSTCKCDEKGDRDQYQFVCASCGLRIEDGENEGTEIANTCSCDFPVYLPLTPDLQNETISVCKNCGKRIGSQAGSMTQWIFGEGRCACEKPEPMTESIVSLIQNSFQGFTDEDRVEELKLLPRDFPLERYQPLAELGRGATGVVYRCRDRILRKKVAVKTITMLSPEQIVSFQEEARATARLKHANIVSILDFGATESGKPFMVMDYIDGASLEKHLAEEGALHENTARQIFSHLADALAYAHSQGVFHRDLKPGNIMLSETETGLVPQLIDFGIAKVKEATGLVTIYQDRTLAGTPAYMSPDPVLSNDYDARSEIYSLGCVLFEALTGDPPFKADSALETLYMHAHHEPPLLTETVVGTSERLNQIVAKCLSKERSNRFSSMTELQDALTDETARQPSSYLESSPATELETVTPRQLVILSVVLIALIALAAAPIVTTLQPDPTPNKPIINARYKFHKSTIASGGYCLRADYDVTDEDLMDVRNHLGRLTKLDLTKTNITGDGLKYLTGLPIHFINLTNTSIKGNNLRHLAKMNHLSVVDLSDTAVNDQDLELLSGSTIKDLSLNDCEQITDQGVRLLRGLELHQLKLIGTGVTDEGLLFLSDIKMLKEIHLDKTKVTDRGIAHLAELPINSIRMTDCPNVTGASLRLAGSTWLDLAEIGFGSSHSTPGIKVADFRRLSGLKDMVYIESWNVPITDKELEIVAKSFPRLHWLYVRGGNFTDSGLQSLYKLRNLRRLGLWNSNISRISLQKLASQRPEIIVLTGEPESFLPHGLSDMYKQSELDKL